MDNGQYCNEQIYLSIHLFNCGPDPEPNMLDTGTAPNPQEYTCRVGVAIIPGHAPVNGRDLLICHANT